MNNRVPSSIPKDVVYNQHIAQAVQNIKDKYNKLKYGELQHEEQLQKTFQPIAKLLNSILDAVSNKTTLPTIKKEDKDHIMQPCLFPIEETISPAEIMSPPPSPSTDGKNIGTIARRYLQLLDNCASKEYLDRVYGIREERDSYHLGDSEVHFNVNDIIINNKTYKGTKGLYELIFKKCPDENVYKKRDLSNYKEILFSTNVHRVKHRSDEQLLSNKGLKYVKIIKVLFPPKRKKKKQQSGEGIKWESELNRSMDYTYWNDPNELVNRLRLLMKVKSKGYTNLDDEIALIIKELRESGIIE